MRFASADLIRDQDSASAFSASGRSIQTATITIPTPKMGHEEVVARPGTLPTQACQVWLAATEDTDENTPEMLDGYNIDGVCETDQIRFFWRSIRNEVGLIKLNYEVI